MFRYINTYGGTPYSDHGGYACPPPPIFMPPGTIVPMGAYCFYCVRMYVCMYVRVRLKFLVKVFG